MQRADICRTIRIEKKTGVQKAKNEIDFVIFLFHKISFANMEFDESITFNLHLTAVAPREPKAKRTRILSDDSVAMTEDTLKKSFELGIKSGWSVVEGYRELQVSPFLLEVRVESRLNEFGDFCVLIYDDPEDNSYVLKARWLTNITDVQEDLTMNEIKSIYENGKALVRALHSWVVDTLL